MWGMTNDWQARNRFRDMQAISRAWFIPLGIGTPDTTISAKATRQTSMKHVFAYNFTSSFYFLNCRFLFRMEHYAQ